MSLDACLGFDALYGAASYVMYGAFFNVLFSVSTAVLVGWRTAGGGPEEVGASTIEWSRVERSLG